MGGMWGEYVPVAVRRAKAMKEMEKLQKKGQNSEPVKIDGTKIAKKFWGMKWCNHIESFADYSNRLPRGRTYARNGSICHLSIQKGSFEAIVSGSSLYKVSVNIITLAQNKWEAIKKRCSGQIGSILELLQGKISDHVMTVVSDHKEGLFPGVKEINFKCSCPDWAGMCKHVAAVLYGVGNRLDTRPELLFLLRGVDPSELVSTKLSVETLVTADRIDDGELGDIFGIDLDTVPETKPSRKNVQKKTTVKEKVKATGKVNKVQKRPKKALDFDKLTGKKLQAIRKEMNLSVDKFASVLGMTPATIQRWEDSWGVLKLQFRSRNALKDLLN